MSAGSIRSIATKLGVSRTAVSLALRDSPRISEPLRRKIKQAAAKSGYIPNARLQSMMRELRQSVDPSFREHLAMLSLFPDAAPPWKGWQHLRIVADAARTRAHSLGYSLDWFWLKEPGMTPKRLRGILETRGIQGIFSLGALDPDEAWPAELAGFAVTTFAMSISTPLHRVASHFHCEAMALFARLKQDGYQRPGLVMLRSGERRTSYMYPGAFLVFQQRFLQPPHAPILTLDEFNEGALRQWLHQYQPDVIVFHPPDPFVEPWESFAKAEGLRVPRDIGVAFLGGYDQSRGYSGCYQDLPRMGACAIEMLIGRVQLRDFSLPLHPKTEFVEGCWVQGWSTRRKRS
jgi:DNA-binding LacI/PurR family transcriptional regulator